MTEIEELESRLKQLREADRVASEERIRKQQEAFYSLPYEWVVDQKQLTIQRNSGWNEWSYLFPSLKEGDKIPAVYVRRRKVGYDPKIHGTQLHADKWDGMTYLRTEEGVLFKTGGGTYVLYDCLLISREEWDALYSGNIPERFKRK